MISLQLVGLIVLISLVETLGQFFIRLYHEKGHRPIIYMILGWLVYYLVLYVLEKMYDFTGMGLANAMWSGLTIITVALVDKYYFKETITKLQWIGFGIIIVGMFVAGFD